jgi:hypothetical protein
MITFLSNRDVYTSVVCSLVPQTTERLWIATADIRDMYVDTGAATFAANVVDVNSAAIQRYSFSLWVFF